MPLPDGATLLTFVDVTASKRYERALVERQQAFVSKTEDFIRKNIAGQKTKQAQSRRKMLDKLDKLCTFGCTEYTELKKAVTEYKQRKGITS